MDGKKIMAIMSNKTRIFSVIDGKLQKKDALAKKALWMPACLAARPLASAGMTTGVGGNSQ